MSKRPGVTIMEVLAAAMVIVVAMVGISTAATSALKRSRTPNLTEQAALLASERLNYFRTQQDPFRAVGGTHYIFRPNDAQDYNSVQNFNNNFNDNPQPFVREYLYGTAEGQLVAVGANGDTGRDNQRMRTLTGDQNFNGQFYGRNQVPPTQILAPAAALVLMRVGRSPLWDNTAIPAPLPVPPDPTFNQMIAPRANPSVPNGVGSVIPRDIKFVREVWVQTNHPLFKGGGPAAKTVEWNPPQPARNLPDYAVSVTVRVFARDERTLTYNPVTNPVNAPRSADFSGPGYDRQKPLVSLNGLFSLKRILN